MSLINSFNFNLLAKILEIYFFINVNNQTIYTSAEFYGLVI